MTVYIEESYVDVKAFITSAICKYSCILQVWHFLNCIFQHYCIWFEGFENQILKAQLKLNKPLKLYLGKTFQHFTSLSDAVHKLDVTTLAHFICNPSYHWHVISVTHYDTGKLHLRPLKSLAQYIYDPWYHLHGTSKTSDIICTVHLWPLMTVVNNIPGPWPQPSSPDSSWVWGTVPPSPSSTGQT